MKICQQSLCRHVGSVKDFFNHPAFIFQCIPSDGDFYSKCYAREFEEARQSANDAFILSTIRNSTGLLGSVMNFIGAIAPGLSTGEWISRIGNFINAQRQNFINQIQAVQRKRQQVTRVTEMRICQSTARRRMAAYHVGKFEPGRKPGDDIYSGVNTIMHTGM